jgi:hypothetical protein
MLSFFIVTDANGHFNKFYIGIIFTGKVELLVFPETVWMDLIITIIKLLF